MQDRAYVLHLIPTHPADEAVPLDFDSIGRFFGRHASAVRQQYYSITRTIKEAKRETRKGGNYVELMQEAMRRLPGQQGTIFDIQAVLKKEFSSHLDKYKVKGKAQWKKVVGECLREQGEVFERLPEKTASGKIVWRLKQEETTVRVRVKEEDDVGV